MGRTNYDAKMVESYRNQVQKVVVPLANEVVKENGLRIGIKNPKFYDQALQFLDGNPTPKGTKDELVEKALNMYTEMSPETKEFFEFLLELIYSLVSYQVNDNSFLQVVDLWCDY